MADKKFTVMLSETQAVKILECDPQKAIFDIAREAIGCDWIEIVQPDALTNAGYLLLIDEEGKLRERDLKLNCIASDLYGSDQHGDPIIGNAVIVKDGNECLSLLTKDEAEQLASTLAMNRRNSIEKMAKAFGIRPTPKPNLDAADPTRRQSCKMSSMER